MGISITINDINDLTDTERAVLRLIADDDILIRRLSSDEKNELVLSGETKVADTLKAAVRGMAAPAPAPAPSAPAPSAPAPSGAAELDAAGLPWDKRIHSSSRAKVADGTWRYARNLDKALIATVEAELRAVQAIPSPVAAATSTNPPGWPFTEATVDNTFATHGSPELDADAAKLEALAGAGAAGPTVADVTAPVAPAPIVPLPPAAPTALPMTFAQLMQHVTPLLVSGKLTQPVLQGVAEKFGLPHLAALGARPDLVEAVKAAIDEAVGGVQ